MAPSSGATHGGGSGIVLDPVGSFGPAYGLYDHTDRESMMSVMARPASNHWKIVVGIDGSAPAQRALKWAVDAANAFDSEVLAVHAVGLLETQHAPTDDDLNDPSAPATKHADHISNLAHAIQRRLDEVAGPAAVRLVLEPGSPADAILRVARDERADLVVVGRRGTGEPYQLGLGSTSRSVASLADVPVVVVPADDPSPNDRPTTSRGA